MASSRKLADSSRSGDRSARLDRVARIVHLTRPASTSMTSAARPPPRSAANRAAGSPSAPRAWSRDVSSLSSSTPAVNARHSDARPESNSTNSRVAIAAPLEGSRRPSIDEKRSRMGVAPVRVY
ncbi:hypothetical protein [Aquisphaera insulae]|uniref:hypothetical protein n=1 Tax=Aquisphaera insulae TaxID=2712864 RepID=UPI0013EAF65E|nr:hypothetical protein [Aquisphaera insulae]